MQLTPDKSGYVSVNLYGMGRMRRRRVHALVAEAFIGPRPRRFQVAHGDSIRTNNAVTNLRYATCAENIADKFRSVRNANARTVENEVVKGPERDVEAFKGERWLPIVGWAQFYEVSSLGRIRSLDRVIIDTCRGGERRRFISGRLLSPRVDSRGYASLPLYGGGATKRKYAHSLVAAAFLGPRPEGHDVAHNDGNPSNNALSNLRYATRADNMADCVAHGTRHTGEMSPAAKLSAADVREIRKVRGNLAILAKHYGIGKMQVSRIQRGLRWADSFEQEKLPELVRKLTEDNVAAIRAMRGRPTAEIARQFKVSPGYVSEILRGAKRSPV